MALKVIDVVSNMILKFCELLKFSFERNSIQTDMFIALSRNRWYKKRFCCFGFVKASVNYNSDVGLKNNCDLRPQCPKSDYCMMEFFRKFH
jgi:hypothetical protein